MMIQTLQWWEITLGGLGTLAIFSFLYRENPFYRFFEHLYIGIATAWVIMATVKSFIWPQFIAPIIGADLTIFPDGTQPEPYDSRLLFYLIPAAFGALYYCISSRRYNWLAQLTIGFSLGVGAGMTFEGLFNEMLPQVEDSFRPLYVPGAPGETFRNIVFVVTLLSTMSYFLFTFERKKGSLMSTSASTGRWLLMCSFGASFGATIMARMALLVERLDFLINRWWPNFFS